MIKKEIYGEIKQRLNSVKLFDTLEINIKIKPKFSKDDASHVNGYEIEAVMCNSLPANAADWMKQVQRQIQRINKRVNNNWKIFYVYKEIFQIITENATNRFNYFRGQNKDWDLLPGIYRGDLDDAFVSNYDQIYEDIAKEYPENLKYIPFDDNLEQIEKRANQLAYLQHYGYRTSLLDITKNPFIALQFMLKGCTLDEWCPNTFYAFAIDPRKHERNNIFMSTMKGKNNNRIKAQFGAFLNFDRLYKIVESGIQKIPTLKIIISKDISDVIKDIDAGIESAKELQSTNNEVGQQMEAAYKQLKKSVPENVNKELYYFIFSEMVSKMREYYYLEENLFPDFADYVMFTKDKYLDSNEPMRLNNQLENIARDGKKYEP
ncbi:FRG domain-containing protein [Limosilactobacillus reuteri]|uniref:FRG domain-containing protein n=1 Tax=Limosilactobacillus reuteri TaxID=1598 RepID=UPI001E5A9E0B|nr:FRG domain-containing protein [Limosilactobacillus reuteri]MCC4367602.1 FRG domain-containing protein [Limosilactobacillus reuteri]